MSRYFVSRARKAMWIEDETWGSPMSFVPTVDERVATDTGLVDANGDPIMRAPNPVGFGKDDEW